MSIAEAPPVEALPDELFARLRSSRKWVLVLGLITGTGAVGILLEALRIAKMDESDRFDPTAIAWMALGVACLYLTVAIYLLRYEAAIGRAVAQRGTPLLEAAMRLQGRLFRLVVLVIVAFVLGIALVVALGVMAP